MAGELRVIFMDVGQGDATLVVYPDNSLMLVDCGSVKSSGAVRPQIKQILQDYLQHTPSKKTIHTLVLTHPDIDHYNQIVGFTTELDIEYTNIIYGGALGDYNQAARKLLNDRKAAFVKSICGVNQYADPHDVRNAVLSRADVDAWVLSANHDKATSTKKTDRDKNDQSVVLLLKYKGTRIYLMGDATTSTEMQILTHYKPHPKWLEPDPDERVILKLGHHGSEHSTSEAWLRAIRPEGLFASADLVSHGHPRKSVIDLALTHAPIDRKVEAHDYVVYDNVSAGKNKYVVSRNSTHAIFTTIYREIKRKKAGTKTVVLTDYLGGSYHYVIDASGKVSICSTDQD